MWNNKNLEMINKLNCDGCCRFFVCNNNILVGTNENYVIFIDWHNNNIQEIVPCENKLYSLLVYDLKSITFAGDCFGNINVIQDKKIIFIIKSKENNTKGHKGSINILYRVKQNMISAGEHGEIKIWDIISFEH